MTERTTDAAAPWALVPPLDEEESDPTETARRTWPALDLAALLRDDRPPREWVVDGLLPAASAVSFVAPAGAGKSLFALALAVAVARGDDRFAGLPVSRARRVLYIDAENTEDDLAERLTDMGVTAETAEQLGARLHLLHLPTLDPLDTALGGGQLCEILDGYGLDLGDVVVLDSHQRLTAGPENDSDTQRAYYRHTGLKLKRRGLSVVRTDNTGKDAERGGRGSSGKRDDVDVEWVISRSDDTLTLKPTKQRISDVAALTVRCITDDADGRLTYSTAEDPYRREIARVVADLDRLGLDPGAGYRPCYVALTTARRRAAQNIVRAAVKERKRRPTASVELPEHGAA